MGLNRFMRITDYTACALVKYYAGDGDFWEAFLPFA